jgi:hypothetical protein
MWFLYVEWQTRRVPETRWVRVHVQISTRNLFTGGWVITLPDLLPSLDGTLAHIWMFLSERTTAYEQRNTIRMYDLGAWI